MPLSLSCSVSRPLLTLHSVPWKPPFQTLTLSRAKGVKNPQNRGFPGGTVVENPPANAGDTGSIPGPGRSHIPWSN